MGPVVSQKSTDVCAVLPPPLHSETDSIQKGNIMFCHIFFPICYLSLLHLFLSLLFYECTLSMPQTLDSVKYNIKMQKAVRIYV